MSSERQWVVVAKADNPHDFEVWGPYTSDEADAVFERLADRSDRGIAEDGE